MNDTHLEVLSAFCDGEAVDPGALARALDDPHGRALLVDFVTLREAVQRPDGPLPASLDSLRRTRRPERHESLQESPACAPAGQDVRRAERGNADTPGLAAWLQSARVPLPAAAALLVVALLASFAWPGNRAADGPPAPPTPTQTLRFIPGVDWQMP